MTGRAEDPARIISVAVLPLVAPSTTMLVLPVLPAGIRTSAVTVPSEPAVAVTVRPLDPTRIVTVSPGVNPFATTVNVDPGLADVGTSSVAAVFVDGAAESV